MDLNVNFRLLRDERASALIITKLNQIIVLLNSLSQGVAQMSVELDALEAEVGRNTEVDQSAIALIQGLAAQIEALKNDPVKLQALADSMKASSDALAAAVVANTPAAP